MANKLILSYLVKLVECYFSNIHTTMRAFVMMRQWAISHQELNEKLTALEQQYGQKFKDIEC